MSNPRPGPAYSTTSTPKGTRLWTAASARASLFMNHTPQSHSQGFCLLCDFNYSQALQYAHACMPFPFVPASRIFTVLLFYWRWLWLVNPTVLCSTCGVDYTHYFWLAVTTPRPFPLYGYGDDLCKQVQEVLIDISCTSRCDIFQCTILPY